MCDMNVITERRDKTSADICKAIRQDDMPREYYDDVQPVESADSAKQLGCSSSAIIPLPISFTVLVIFRLVT